MDVCELGECSWIASNAARVGSKIPQSALDPFLLASEHMGAEQARGGVRVGQYHKCQHDCQLDRTIVSHTQGRRNPLRNVDLLHHFN